LPYSPASLSNSLYFVMHAVFGANDDGDDDDDDDNDNDDIVSV